MLHVNHLWELKGLFLHVTQYCNCTCSSTLLIVLSDLYLILYPKAIIELKKKKKKKKVPETMLLHINLKHKFLLKEKFLIHS